MIPLPWLLAKPREYPFFSAGSEQRYRAYNVLSIAPGIEYISTPLLVVIGSEDDTTPNMPLNIEIGSN